MPRRRRHQSRPPSADAAAVPRCAADRRRRRQSIPASAASRFNPTRSRARWQDGPADAGEQHERNALDHVAIRGPGPARTPGRGQQEHGLGEGIAPVRLAGPQRPRPCSSRTAPTSRVWAGGSASSDAVHSPTPPGDRARPSSPPHGCSSPATSTLRTAHSGGAWTCGRRAGSSGSSPPRRQGPCGRPAWARATATPVRCRSRTPARWPRRGRRRACAAAHAGCAPPPVSSPPVHPARLCPRRRGWQPPKPARRR